MNDWDMFRIGPSNPVESRKLTNPCRLDIQLLSVCCTEGGDKRAQSFDSGIAVSGVRGIEFVACDQECT